MRAFGPWHAWNRKFGSQLKPPLIVVLKNDELPASGLMIKSRLSSMILVCVACPYKSVRNEIREITQITGALTHFILTTDAINVFRNICRGWPLVGVIHIEMQCAIFLTHNPDPIACLQSIQILTLLFNVGDAVMHHFITSHHPGVRPQVGHSEGEIEFQR